LCKTEVVVGAEVDAFGLGASEFEGPTVIIGHAIFEDDGVGWDAANWTVPAIFYSPVAGRFMKIYEYLRN
jgi:hypothetical protein